MMICDVNIVDYVLQNEQDRWELHNDLDKPKNEIIIPGIISRLG